MKSLAILSGALFLLAHLDKLVGDALLGVMGSQVEADELFSGHLHPPAKKPSLTRLPWWAVH